jgi:DNA-directed RNA polymerase subunit RPC12/RpoP
MLKEREPRMNSILSLFNVPSTYQDFFPSFGAMFTLFLIVFIVVIVLIVLSFAFNFWRMIKSGKAQDQIYAQPTQPQPPVAEKEIIREIVKIRCPYCGNLYDEDQNNCPNCGAKR